MREFLEASTAINKDIERLNEYAEDLKKFTLLKQNSVLVDEEEVALDRKIDTLNEAFQELSDKIKLFIKSNQKETKAFREKGVKKSIIDMRELHTFRQGRDLSEVLRKYQNIQCDYKQREKEKLKETFLIANPKASAQDLEMLAEGEQGEAILASAFALGSHSAQSILIQAKNRKKKIEKIVDTINTLVSLIEEIDRLVRKNTHVVDQITVNMTSAEEHTTQANRELDSALRYEIRSMRIKRIIAGFFFILIIIFIVYFFRDAIFNRKKNNTNNFI